MRQTHSTLDLLLGAYSRRSDFNSPTGLAGSCRSLCPFPQGPLRQLRGGEHRWQPQQFAGTGKPQCCSRNPPAGSGRRAPCRDKPTIPRDAALSARRRSGVCRWCPGLGGGGRTHSTQQGSAEQRGLRRAQLCKGSSREQLPRKVHGDLRLRG